MNEYYYNIFQINIAKLCLSIDKKIFFSKFIINNINRETIKNSEILTIEQTCTSCYKFRTKETISLIRAVKLKSTLACFVPTFLFKFSCSPHFGENQALLWEYVTQTHQFFQALTNHEIVIFISTSTNLNFSYTFLSSLFLSFFFFFLKINFVDECRVSSQFLLVHIYYF